MAHDLMIQCCYLPTGFLETNPEIPALEGPNLYYVSSLVDKTEATDSAFHILEPPPDGSVTYGLGYAATNNQILVDLARSPCMPAAQVKG